ncbi:MAG: SsrA-binding protein SmpB [Deltaproteobacteria bacterium]|nr:SsrA-binding protein SmpB [Candidatus Anaeroferrophillus wilburensis]MBN2888722.1 SsrA-binding protein SmpB [Deltaproteobacteria bacterium]
MSIKLICSNKKARLNFEILETFEAGIVLQGTEVKSLRDGKASMNESYARITDSEIWLVQFHISPYTHGNIANHEPLRPRKLLLHKREIRRLIGKVTEKGLTLVPLKAYFKDGKAKIELALGKGKKIHDKRDDLKQKAVKRDMEREFKAR